jgi:hypothetical protein
MNLVIALVPFDGHFELHLLLVAVALAINNEF